MNQQLKQRLTGAIVLVILGVIFLPMILDKPEPVKPESAVTELPFETPVNATGQVTIPEEVIARYVPEDLPPQKAGENHVVNDTSEEVESEENTDPEKKAKSHPDEQLHTNIKAPVSETEWYIQAGSFSSKQNADLMVKRLLSGGFNAYHESIESGGRRLYRVRVGPFDSGLKAKEIKQKLEREDKLKTIIVATAKQSD